MLCVSIKYLLYVMCGPLNICYMLCVAIKYLLYVMCGH